MNKEANTCRKIFAQVDDIKPSVYVCLGDNNTKKNFILFAWQLGIRNCEYITRYSCKVTGRFLVSKCYCTTKMGGKDNDIKSSPTHSLCLLFLPKWKKSLSCSFRMVQILFCYDYKWFLMSSDNQCFVKVSQICRYDPTFQRWSGYPSRFFNKWRNVSLLFFFLKLTSNFFATCCHQNET